MEGSRASLSSLSGAAIWRTGRVVVTTLTVLTNMAGTATVLLITFFVVPIPRITNLSHLSVVEALAAIAYIVVAFPVGALIGTRRLFELRHWLRDERGQLTQSMRHICWDGCMFPNAVMNDPKTWNDILAAMIAVRAAHGWIE